MKKLVSIILASILVISAMFLLLSCDNGYEKETEKPAESDETKPETNPETKPETNPETELEIDGKYFKVEGTAIIGLTEEGKKLEKIVIPAEIGGVKITEVGDFAFSDPEGNEENFNKNLTDIEIGNNVKYIGRGAFAGCAKLANVKIGEKVSTIDELPFFMCPSLSNIEVDKNNKVFYSEGNCLIGKENKELLLGHSKSKIPDGVEAISMGAFMFSGIENVTLPDSVFSIEGDAFYGCTGLKSVKIGNKLMNIGVNAFGGCSNLISINIPDSVTSIEAQSFQDCTSLTSITIPDSVMVVREWAFDGCSSLKSVKIGNGVGHIGSSAFKGCRSLTSINIPNAVKSIGSSAFLNCSGLTSITIPDSVTEIRNDAFSGCSSLKSITIPGSVTLIGNDAFARCTSLSEVYYKGTAEQWDGMTICINNDHLTNATRYYYSETQDMSCTLTKICNINGTDLKVPEKINGLTVSAIADYAFEHITEITTISLPNTVKSIGTRAFYNCSSLTSINIPDSVLSIGEYPFLNCINLKKVRYDGTLEQLKTANICNIYRDIECVDGIYVYKEDPTIKSEGVLTYDEFIASEIEKEIVIEAYIQDKQIYFEKYGDITLYLRDADGAYLVQRMECTEYEAAKFTIGTKVKVTGIKTEWSGEVYIMDARVEILEGNYIFETKDMTSHFGNEAELIKVQNQKVIFKGVKVEASKIDGDETEYAWLYRWNGKGKEGDDLYIKLSLNGKTYSFLVENALRNENSDVYKAVKKLKVGDTIDVEGFLCWYGAPQLQITNVVVK